MLNCLTEILVFWYSSSSALPISELQKIPDQETTRKVAMATQRLLANDGKCGCNATDPNSILYKILNKEEYEKTKSNQQQLYYSVPPLSPHIGCPCEVNRTVTLKTPGITTSTRALEVLLKTVTFIRKLPSFFQLPLEDQILLTQQGWAPLFILGLAQERVELDLKETSVPSLLKAVLLNQSWMDKAALEHFPVIGASITEVQKIKNFLGKFWNADLCAKEYAYLKGIVLFNPELWGLKYHGYVQTLQMEAQHTLMEFISTMHSKHRWRYTWIMEMLAFLRNIDTDAVRDLFFRPILGRVDFNGLLLATLYSK